MAELRVTVLVVEHWTERLLSIDKLRMMILHVDKTQFDVGVQSDLQ